jgi:hypothetical protein
MAKSLGCSFDLNCVNPTIKNENVVIMPDSAHMCKLIRNVFDEKRKMLNCNNELIDFISSCVKFQYFTSSV